MALKTAAQLYKDELYVMQDAGLIIDRDWHNHLYDLEGDELRQEMINLHEESDICFFYQNPTFFILKYTSLNGETCVGAFIQLKDKYEGSTFINESDKEFLSNLVGRKDANGEDILLGDQVRIGESQKAHRVIWSESGFWLYDDYYDCIDCELGTDCKITKT